MGLALTIAMLEWEWALSRRATPVRETLLGFALPESAYGAGASVTQQLEESILPYRFTVAARPSHREPLAYTIAPRTIPTLKSQFTNPRPPVRNGTTPIHATALATNRLM